MPDSEVIGVYRRTTEFSSTAAGTCQWAQATDPAGSKVFLKKFLGPTYPLDGGPGSEKVKLEKRAKCERFRRRHAAVTKALGSVAKHSASVAIQIDFFADGAHFYKVTEWIDPILDMREIGSQPYADRRQLAIDAAKGVQVVHNTGIVHSDLKPDNIMVRRHEAGGSTATVIDLDTSYPERGSTKKGFTSAQIAEMEPTPETLGGDPVYYSPEALRYMKGHSGPDGVPGYPSDVFAFGLILHQMLSKGLPGYDRSRYDSIAHAVANGDSLSITCTENRELQPLLCAMLSDRPEERPSMMQVVAQLSGASKVTAPIVIPPPPPHEKIGIRGSGLDAPGVTPTPPPRDKIVIRGSGLGTPGVTPTPPPHEKIGIRGSGLGTPGVTPTPPPHDKIVIRGSGLGAPGASPITDGASSPSVPTPAPSALRGTGLKTAGADTPDEAPDAADTPGE